MSRAKNPPSLFHFELSANGEQTTFKEVSGMVTEVVLKNSLKQDENPFRYRIPSLPKGNLELKNGVTHSNSKLLEWCLAYQNPGKSIPKSNAILRLKDAQGNSLVEWTLHRVHTINNKPTKNKGQTKGTQIESLELGYSFFSLSKK